MAQKKKQYKIQNYTIPAQQSHKIQIKFDRKTTNHLAHCICITQKEQTVLITCKFCNRKYHNCIIPQNKLSKSCISCDAKLFDPIYEVRKQLLETYFTVKPVTQFEQTFKFEFESINQNQLKQNQIIQIRCMSTFVQQKINTVQLAWPMQGTIKANNLVINQLKPLLAQSNLKKRRQQVLVLHHQQLNKRQSNNIQLKIGKHSLEKIQSAYKYTKNSTIYFIGIYIIKVLTIQQLYQKIQNKFSINKQEAQKKYFSGIEGSKIFMADPISGGMVKIPVRGRDCIHTQVFCLQSFIKIHHQKRKWNCPVCNYKVCTPLLDLWLKSLLDLQKVESNLSNYIQVKKNKNDNFIASWVVDSKNIGIEIEEDNKDSQILIIQQNQQEKSNIKSKKNIKNEVNMNKKQDNKQDNLFHTKSLKIQESDLKLCFKKNKDINKQQIQIIDDNEELIQIIKKKYKSSKQQVNIQNSRQNQKQTEQDKKKSFVQGLVTGRSLKKMEKTKQKTINKNQSALNTIGLNPTIVTQLTIEKLHQIFQDIRLEDKKISGNFMNSKKGNIQNFKTLFKFQ